MSTTELSTQSINAIVNKLYTDSIDKFLSSEMFAVQLQIKVNGLFRSIYWAGRAGGAVLLNTPSYTFEEVNLLINVLTVKFNLKCTINKNKGHHVIRISGKSLPELQTLLKDIMPPMMLHKIGL